LPDLRALLGPLTERIADLPPPATTTTATPAPVP
jgi:hypothetical protein